MNEANLEILKKRIEAATDEHIKIIAQMTTARNQWNTKTGAILRAEITKRGIAA